MSDYLEKTFIFKSTDFKLEILSGVVIDTNTRSDTYVSGSGSSSSYRGSGSGSTQISSTVMVTKEVWIKAVSGKEYRLQFSDYAIRTGHVIHLGYVDDIQQILYNQTTDQFWYIGGFSWSLKASSWAPFWWLTLFIFPLTGWLIFSLAAIIGINRPGIDWTYIGTLVLIGAGLVLALLGSFLISLFYEILTNSSRTKDANGCLYEVFFSTRTKLNEIANQLQSKPPTAITQSESAFCSGCGKPAVPDGSFCGGCGTKLIAA